MNFTIMQKSIEHRSQNMTIKIEIGIIDINGFVWNFDGYRVYLVDAEFEMESGENGYPCNTLTDAENLVRDNSGGLLGDMQTKFKHISTIKSGDTIVHNGKMVTVCKKDIHTGGFFGTSVFGDSYRDGERLVKVVQFPQFYKGIKI